MRKAILNLLWVNCMCKMCSSHKKRSSNNSKFMVFVEISYETVSDSFHLRSITKQCQINKTGIPPYIKLTSDTNRSTFSALCQQTISQRVQRLNK